MLKKLISDESGRALALTLIILGIGVLLIPVFLAHASTNLYASQATEEGLKEQYAADSGVEYALWQLQNGIITSQNPYTYTINNKDVAVTWGECPSITGTYKITSTATSADGSSTTIESYISLSILDFDWLFDSAITSPGSVTIRPGSVVTGTVRCYEGELDPDELDRIDKWEPYPEDESWPTEEELRAFYREQVDVSTPYPYDSIDVASGTEVDPYPIGPLYYVWDGLHPLQIESSQKDYNATAVLTGTIYVAGDLNIGGAKEFTLDFHGQTIYVEGDIDISDKCTITGSGAIIAEGNITFAPKIESNPDDFLFIMSTGETSTVQPQGSLYGVVAGSADVQLQPNCFLQRTDEPVGGFNFPDGSSGNLEILTYNIGP